MVQPLWKAVWRLFNKNIARPYDPIIPLLGIYLKNLKIFINRYICTFKFITPLLTVAKTSKKLKCPSIGDWIKKMWYIYEMEY